MYTNLSPGVNVQGSLDLKTQQHRDLLIGSIIHSADVSTPLLPLEQYRKWAIAVALEFNNQV